MNAERVADPTRNICNSWDDAGDYLKLNDRKKTEEGIDPGRDLQNTGIIQGVPSKRRME